MRDVFAEYDFGYWTAAFPVMLEKHGWLDFDTAEPSVMADAANLAAYDVVIVGWLPPGSWRQEWADSLADFRGLLFLEGPLPPELLALAGAGAGGQPRRLSEGRLRFGPASEAYIERRFGRSFYLGHRSQAPSTTVGLDPDDNPLVLVPKRVATRTPGQSRDRFANLGTGTVSDQAGRAAASLVLAYRTRFERNGEIFDDTWSESSESLAVLFSVRCVAKVHGRSMHAVLRDFVRRLIDAQSWSSGAVDFGLAALRAMASAEAAAVFNDEALEMQAADLLDESRFASLKEATGSSQSRAWQAYASLAVLDRAGASDQVPAAQLAPFLPAFPGPYVQRRDMPLVWLLQMISSQVYGELPAPLVDLAAWLESVAQGLVQGATVTWPQETDGFRTEELMLLIGALMAAGHTEAADRAWRDCVRVLYDRRRASFWNGVVTRGGVERLSAVAVSPWLALALVGLATEINVPDAADAALAGYEPAQVKAWAAAPYWLEAVELADAVTEVSLSTDDGDVPAVWRSNNVIATSFQLLSYLTHLHTMHPLDAPYAGYRHIDGMVLEYLLFNVLARAATECGALFLSVAPWPWDIDYCVTIRHDVDRILTPEQFDRVFDLEQRNEMGVSWFWLPDRLEEAQLRRLHGAPRHEIGLHSVRFGEKEYEWRSVKSVAPPETEILGEAYHGAGDSWLGHPSVREAVELGFVYTELVPAVADVPYWSFPSLAPDGAVYREPILGITFNGSIDGKQGDAPETQSGPRLYRQLLNHPDINYDRLELQIEGLPEGNRLGWTCDQVARWWKATHRREALLVQRLGDDSGAQRYRVVATGDVDDLEVRFNVNRDDVRAVTASGLGGNPEPREMEWRALSAAEMEGIRVRLPLSRDVPVDIRVEISRNDAEQLSVRGESAITAD